MQKYVDCRLIAQRFIVDKPDHRGSKGSWVIIPTSLLSDPTNESDWLRLHPLRVSVISLKKSKIGTATNCLELREILASIAGGKSHIPYKVGKHQEDASKLSLGPRTGTVDRDPVTIYGPTAR